MLRIANIDLAANARTTLEALQAQINAKTSFSDKVTAAKNAWKTKTSTKAKADAFQTVRKTLALMCVGPVRCAYCEDSLADEIEHVRPKNLFPEHAFLWSNYVFACGPCNGPKGNRYGILNHGKVDEFIRASTDPVAPPPAGVPALIDPRSEDPLDFLELDLGGTLPDGTELCATFQFLPNAGANPEARARAAFSIDVLGLNREVIRVARENAFSGFRARLYEYVKRKDEGKAKEFLNQIRDDILSTPHLTVFAEMRRQSQYLPDIRNLFDRAPEAQAWPLVPPVK